MATVEDTQAAKAKHAYGSRFHSLMTPRFWHGMLFSTWARLLIRNRFAISPRKMPMAGAISLFSVGNSSLRLLQELIYRRKADATEIAQPPLFILGHWRSGTTLLHELLVLDERHTYPSTYQCMAPNHFLLTNWLVTRWLGFVLPAERPMDRMAAGWNRPQEDEFAICNLGIPSPYLAMAFPNRPPPCPEYLDLEEISPEERARWKAALVWFLKRLAYRDPRRIVLKSPTHTARIKTLLEAFPNARFIHIVRDPYVIFPSTVRLWKSLNFTQGMQVSRDEGLEEYVFESFERMYRRFDEQRELVDPGRFHELRYEDLVSDPMGEMRKIYEHLDLGGFEALEPKLEAYFDQARDYRTNKHELSPELRSKITDRWADYLRRYGYTQSSSAASEKPGC